MRLFLPSVNYADFLAVTLPAWRAFLPDADIYVITRKDDQATVDVALGRQGTALGVTGVVVLWTEAWTRDGAAFNKAAALDIGLAASCPREGDAVVIADADVIPFGSFDETALHRGTIYGCARYRCESPAQLEAHRSGALPLADLSLIPPRRRGEEPDFGRTVAPHEAAAACTGYFQAFRYRPGVSFGSYPTAAGYDSAFRRQFTQRVGLTSLYVLHLGALDRRNWTGRVVPRWTGAQA